MKQSTKNVIALPSVVLVLLGIFGTWYIVVMHPQRKVAIRFLESLKTRNHKMLKETVSPEEYAVYKRLYLKNGFNKHLLSFDNFRERNANDYFWPSSTKFSVDVKEDDTFFGERKAEYFLTVEKNKAGDWKVIQFSTVQDYDDLKKLKNVDQVGGMVSKK